MYGLHKIINQETDSKRVWRRRVTFWRQEQVISCSQRNNNMLISTRLRHFIGILYFIHCEAGRSHYKPTEAVRGGRRKRLD